MLQRRICRSVRHNRYRIGLRRFYHRFPPIGQKHVAHQHNGGVGDRDIVVTALNILCQLQMLLGHFEEHLNIPTFTIHHEISSSGRVISVDSRANQSFVRRSQTKTTFALCSSCSVTITLARIFAWPQRFFRHR